MFHLLIQLLHSEKFEDLSFKHFVVVTFSDTLGNILCLVNHFQCIKVFANEIHVLFDQAYKRAMVQILLTNFVYPFFKGSEKREKKNDDTLLPGHMRIYSVLQCKEYPKCFLIIISMVSMVGPKLGTLLFVTIQILN